ncbi:MAG: hypothetical protein NTW55_03760, partial [Planctomycetota bacterium]|nr:hypothetical protein [Planctomycetota bacterium]
KKALGLKMWLISRLRQTKKVRDVVFNVFASQGCRKQFVSFRCSFPKLPDLVQKDSNYREPCLHTCISANTNYARHKAVFFLLATYGTLCYLYS